METYIFKITHGEASAMVQIAGNASLHDLAELLLSSIGFELDHAFGFYSNLKGPQGMRTDEGEHYTLFADMEDMHEEELNGAGSVEQTAIVDVFCEGRKMVFFFDYGDAWSFIVECTAIEAGRKQSAAKVLSVEGTFPEQYATCDEDEEGIEYDNIINFPSQRQELHLFIYLSGGCQKLFGIKSKDVLRDSEHDLSPSTWLSKWRCEHMCSDADGKHLFLFTHETTFFSILVFQKELSLDNCLIQFRDELQLRLKQTLSLPYNLTVDTEIMKGNPRRLITTMRQIIFEAGFHLNDNFSSYEAIEDDINGRYRSSSFFKPSEAFTEKLSTIDPFRSNNPQTNGI